MAFGASLALGQRWGWATPFGLPSTISYQSRTYYVDNHGSSGRPTCLTSRRPSSIPRSSNLPSGYAPLRPVASVFGYITGSKPIMLPHYEWRRHTPYVLLVRDGACLRLYSLPGEG